MMTPEQNEARKSIIGGSDAGAIIGVSPWANQFTVYQRLVNGFVIKKESIALELGNLLEPWIISKYMHRTGHKVEAIKETVYHPSYKFIGGHVDGYIASENMIFEAKTAKSMQEFGESGTDDIPQLYLCQAYHYLAMEEFRSAVGVYFSVFFKNEEVFKDYFVPRNDKISDALIQQEVDFYFTHVIKNVPPEPANIDEIKIAYCISNGEIKEASEETAGLYEELKTIRANIKQLSTREDYIKSLMMQEMKNAEIFTYNSKNLATWKNQTRESLNKEKLLELAPEAYYQSLEKKSIRVFLIK